MEKPLVASRLSFVVPMFSRWWSRSQLRRRSTLDARRWTRLARLPPLIGLLALALRPHSAWAYPGQAVVEGSQVIFGTLAVLALIGMILASIFNRMYVREALYGLVATFVLFAVVRWAPQLVTLVQQ